VADALSHHPDPPAVCATVSSLVPSWLSSVVASYRDDPAAKTLITKLSVDPTAVSQYSLQSGVLRYHNRIWVGADKDLQQRLIAEFHSSTWGGHSGCQLLICALSNALPGSG
jgi:hypothetical protein